MHSGSALQLGCLSDDKKHTAMTQLKGVIGCSQRTIPAPVLFESTAHPSGCQLVARISHVANASYRAAEFQKMTRVKLKCHDAFEKNVAFYNIDLV